MLEELQFLVNLLVNKCSACLIILFLNTLKVKIN